MKMHIAKNLSVASSLAWALAACTIALLSVADAAQRNAGHAVGHGSHVGGNFRGGRGHGGYAGHGGYNGYGGYGGAYLGICGPIQLTLGLCGPWGY